MKSEQERSKLKRFQDFYLKAKAIIWPSLSYVCHIRSTRAPGSEASRVKLEYVKGAGFGFGFRLRIEVRKTSGKPLVWIVPVALQGYLAHKEEEETKWG